MSSLAPDPEEAPRPRPRTSLSAGDLSPTGIASVLGTMVSGEAESPLAKKLAVVSILRVLIITFSLGASVALRSRGGVGPGDSWSYTLIAATYAVSILYALALRRRVDHVALAYSQIGLDAVFVSALIFLTGGIDSLFSFIYVFVVIGGAMTLFRIGAIMATLTCLLLFAVIVLIQANGWVDYLEPLEFGRAALSYFMYTIGLSLVGALSSALAETVRETGRELAQKETQLVRLEEQHEAILRSLPAGLLAIDDQGNIEYANNAALQLLGVGWEEAKATSLEVLVPPFALPWKSFVSSGSGGRPGRFEETFQRRDGVTLRLGFSFAPLSSDPGLPRTIVVFQDVTDVVRLKESVERAERLATVGKLAAGLAHEVRNPLASMCASIEVLRSELDPPTDLRGLMDNVVRESERLNGLITDFLDFARPRELVRVPSDVSLIVASVIEVFRNEAERLGCSVVTQLEPNAVASVDADRLRQVLWNLARNAVEAMSKKGGGVLTLTTRPLGDEVEITIRDTGTGIPASHRRQIFDPFFTTKDRGSGLGLAIAHAIVQAHQGRILVTTSPGQGTEFTLRLPLRPEESLGSVEGEGRPSGPPPGASTGDLGNEPAWRVHRPRDGASD